MPPTAEARTADRAIACLRKAIEELAAGRPRDALAMVANAQGSVLALRGMVEGQISMTSSELCTTHHGHWARHDH
jgi:hypothetical protein